MFYYKSNGSIYSVVNSHSLEVFITYLHTCIFISNVCSYFPFAYSYSSGMQQVIVQCASGTLQSLTSNKECTQQESFMVGQTLQNMMATYQSICKFE